MKLSTSQYNVIWKMQQGWELWGFEYFFLQKPGQLAGERVHINTIKALEGRLLVRFKKQGYPLSLWELTEDGKKV